jgi:outer membrane protein OmpA-like peptidoglycan-associated protein/Zn/Cd-binding protein ZinT
MRKSTYAIVFFGALVLAGCALPQMVKIAKDQELTVTPNPLEVHADTVKFEMSANLPVKLLKKGKIYTLNTFYKYGENELALDPVVFKAEDYPNSNDQQPKQTKNYSFAYAPAMKEGNLEVQGVASDAKSGKAKETDRMPVAPGIITTSKLVMPSFYAAYADHKYNNQEELVPTNIDFFFDQGRSELKMSERSSERGKQFEAFIAEKNATRTVTITGTHSPEGAERINSRLSEQRAQVIEDFYRRNMKKYDYKGLADSIKFILKPIIEDWTDFKAALSNYDGISSEEKSQYLNIVNGAGNFEEKEKSLRSLPTYKKVFADVYPGLRTAKTEILTVKEKKTDAEIAMLAKNISEEKESADALSIEELMYAATLSPSLAEKEAIYKAATKKTGDWNTHNNLGAVYVAMAIENSNEATKYAQMATTQLEIANNKKESAEAYINMASVALMQGNAGAADKHLKKASALGVSNVHAKGMNGVKGATEIMLARYADAVRSTSAAEETAVNLFNKGLAQLLNKDFRNAVTSFEDAAAKDSNMAMAHYGAAIANARLNNLEATVAALRTAVGKDSALKAVALKDLEFRSFAANEVFRAALR